MTTCQGFPVSTPSTRRGAPSSVIAKSSGFGSRRGASRRSRASTAKPDSVVGAGAGASAEIWNARRKRDDRTDSQEITGGLYRALPPKDLKPHLEVVPPLPGGCEIG